MNRFTRFLSTALLLSPGVALASAPRTYQELANLIVAILDNSATVLIVLGIVVYFYGLSTNMLKLGQGGENKDLRKIIIWGLGVIFLMVSIWGVIRLLQNSFFAGDAQNPTNGGTQGSNCDSFGNCGFGN